MCTANSGTFPMWFRAVPQCSFEFWVAVLAFILKIIMPVCPPACLFDFSVLAIFVNIMMANVGGS
jgi:hypothetical protein